MLKMINWLKIKDKIERWIMIHKIQVWILIRKIVAKNGQSFNQKQEELIRKMRYLIWMYQVIFERHFDWN